MGIATSLWAEPIRMIARNAKRASTVNVLARKAEG